MIRTKRLQLIPVEQRHKRAFADGIAELAALLGVSVPDGWPQFPEAFLPTADQVREIIETAAWGGYFFIDPALAAVVGNGGFHGTPDVGGNAEVGYEIAPQYRNRGYATEAVRGLVQFAFEDARVSRIIAHTLAEKNASNAVLERIGMVFAGELANDEIGKVWRWELCRS
jgi:[ribosomal protein S5]-alanine N-acetyltransferase